MIIQQDNETENLLQLNKEVEENYRGIDVNFSKSYFSFDGNNIWVDPTTTKKVFDEIQKNISYSHEDVFIDCGSGLGHVLYLSSFHFDKVIGIEIVNDVAKECEKNLISLMGSENYSKKIELLIGDMLSQSEDVFDKGTIFYISSPFDNENDFRNLIEKIYQSIKRFDRKVYVIYYYPYFKSILSNYEDCFKFVKELNLIGDVVIYEH